MAASILAALPDALVRYGASLGLDDRALREACDLRPADEIDPDEQVPFAVVTTLWQRIAAAAPDEPVGLRFGQQMTWGHLGILGHIVRHSPTVGAGMMALGRYHRLLDAQLAFTVDDGGARCRVALAHDDAVVRQGHHLEAIVCTVVRGCGDVAGEPAPLDEVWFQHDPRGHRHAYEALFRCPVRFGQATTALFLPSDWLQRSNRIADLSLRHYLERRAAQMLAALPETREADWLSGVRDAVRTAVRQGNPTAQAVATQVNLGVRTLQRRLTDHDTTFAHLLQEVREAEAKDLLVHTRTPVFEVAFRLGYEDYTSFFRAFKRWTGQTPEGFREGRSAPATV